MGLKLRPGFSWFQQTKAVRWNLPRLMMNRQLEAIGEEGLHHQAHLVLGGIAFDARLYVKPIGEDPSRQLGLQGVHLVTRDLVREQNVAEERIIRSREISAIGDVNISGTKREVGLRLVVRLVRLDRRDVELRHSPASPRLLSLVSQVPQAGPPAEQLIDLLHQRPAPGDVSEREVDTGELNPG